MAEDPAARRSRLEAELATARAEGRERVLANRLYALGVLHLRGGRPREAVACLTEADTLYGALHREKQRGQNLRTLALACSAQGEEEEAVSHATVALAVARARGQPAEVIGALATLAAVLHDFRRVPEGLSAYARLLALCRERGDSGSEADALVGRAGLHLHRNARRAAAEDLRAALAIRERMGAPEELSEILCLLGIAELHLRDLDAAEAHLERALALRREAGEQPGIGHALGVRADLQKRRGDIAGAMALREEALAAYRAGGDTRHEASCLTILSGLHLRRGHLPEAARLAVSGFRLSLSDTALADTPLHERQEVERHPVLGPLRFAGRYWWNHR